MYHAPASIRDLFMVITHMIDTSKVIDRRPLSFTSLDQVQADAERIAASDHAGTLKRSGNWTAGQTFNHLATWINFAFDGYPKPVQPPWYISVFLRLKKRTYIEGKMPSGIHIPRVPGGTLGTEVLPTDEGLARLRAAIARLAAHAPEHPSPVFGSLSHAEWIRLNLRHAELHLSFLHPG